MRTRFLSKLTNGEIEDYLDHNDLIYIPVGVTETHGALPVDAETVLAEAVALKMAEASDGLVLHNLPYFFAGGTPTGRGTLQLSVKTGYDYLMAISQSLLKQGFRRQVYVTCHGPAYLYVSSMIRDFFSETNVPILYLDLIAVPQAIEDLSFNFMDKFHQISIGAYKILNRLDDVPLNVPESNSVTYDINKMMTGMQEPPASKLAKYAMQSGAIGYYFNEASTHMVTPLLKTAEQRDELADEGIEAIDELVTKLNLPEIVEHLRQADHYTQTVSLEKYPWLKI